MDEQQQKRINGSVATHSDTTHILIVTYIADTKRYPFTLAHIYRGTHI